jgi:hypothetical protein
MSNMPSGEVGDFEFFEGMLPEPLKQSIRQTQLFTIANQIRAVAESKEKLESDINELIMGHGSW